MTIFDKLRIYQVHMLGFEEGLILSLFDDLTNSITYFQGAKLESCPYISNLFLPLKRRYNLLTYPMYINNMEVINKVLKLEMDKDDTIVTSIFEGGISFYRTIYKNKGFCAGPELVGTLNFVSITNPLICNFLLNFTDKKRNSILKRFIKFDKKNQKGENPIDTVNSNQNYDLSKLNNRED